VVDSNPVAVTDVIQLVDRRPLRRVTEPSDPVMGRARDVQGRRDAYRSTDKLKRQRENRRDVTAGKNKTKAF
jgi:hypothetical protein